MQTVSPQLAPTLEGSFWQWRGHSIYYVSAGPAASSCPPLLLVHGFGASTDHWRKTIQDLSQDFQVWAIDLLGFGRSAKPALAYSGELWQHQLADFIQEVIGQKTVVAGNSLGGYAALCVGANHPDQVAGVILLNSAGPFSDQLHPQKPNVIQQGLKSLLLQSWASNILFQFVRRRQNIRKTLQKVYFNQSAITDQLIEDIYRPSCDPGAPQVFASVFKTPQGEAVDHLLERLASPLLVLWGEKDPWMKTQERGQKFRQYYPHLSEYYLNSGHCPHDDSPELVNPILRQWLQQTFL